MVALIPALGAQLDPSILPIADMSNRAVDYPLDEEVNQE
jgi:hypothetical protein